MKPYLVDWWQNSYTNCLVKHRSKIWFVKSKIGPEKQKERDYLAYLLGSDVCNIAEVKPLSEKEFRSLEKIGIKCTIGASHENTFLVRFCGDYKSSELTHRSLEGALAAEFVFSIWIRRRDAHSYNRYYVGGVPVFFDHETAFLGEEDLVDIGKFFSNGPDPGFPGLWRLELGAHENIDTLATRAKETALFSNSRQEKMTSIPVRDQKAFIKYVGVTTEKITSLSPDFIDNKIFESGFRDVEMEKIGSFLKGERLNLSSRVNEFLNLIQSS